MTATPVLDASEPENHPREAEDKKPALGMTKEQTALMNKADPALSDARLLLENDRVEEAINRMYCAAFDAARAALLRHEEDPSSHAGVKTRFGYHFVRTGVLSRSEARILAEAEAMRNRADDDAFSVFETALIETAPTADLLRDVADVVDEIRSVL